MNQRRRATMDDDRTKLSGGRRRASAQASAGGRGRRNARGVRLDLQYHTYSLRRAYGLCVWCGAWCVGNARVVVALAVGCNAAAGRSKKRRLARRHRPSRRRAPTRAPTRQRSRRPRGPDRSTSEPAHSHSLTARRHARSRPHTTLPQLVYLVGVVAGRVTHSSARAVRGASGPQEGLPHSESSHDEHLHSTPQMDECDRRASMVCDGTHGSRRC